GREANREAANKAGFDEAWQSIKAGLVRGFSIGFSALEASDIEGSWGRRFTRWEWLELSAVTVPANAEASIQSIKSIDAEIRRGCGVKLISAKKQALLGGAVELIRR